MIFELPDFDAHEALHMVHDRASGLYGLIAIHSTHLGPAAGGTRFWAYANSGAAITDALRLSRGMSYKNAMAGLPMGGGKAVILRQPGQEKTPELLHAFGDAIHALSGRYVTAEDVGMGMDDMLAFASRTPFVAGLPPKPGEAGGSPSPATAIGVWHGLRAAIAHKLGKHDVKGLHVAVQGCGAVGGALAERLAAEGARLTLADIDTGRATALAGRLGARVVPPDEIMKVTADVFSPNALGAILNEASIAALDVAVVAGAANNQLATPADGPRLAARGILYAPDYVINAGGIINVVAGYLGRGSADTVAADLAAIGPRLADIFVQADRSGHSCDEVADAMARRLIGR